LARGLVALGTVGGEELAGLPGFELAAGFDFFNVGSVGNLAVGEFVAQLLVRGGAVAGERVDAEVFVEIFEVVFLDPAVEHEANDGVNRALSVVGEDGELDGSAVGVGGSGDDLAGLARSISRGMAVMGARLSFQAVRM
jgi:hypothetical protein